MADETPEEKAAREAAEAEAAKAAAKGAKGAKGDGGASEVTDALNAAGEKGYLGDEVDPTPNENYTFAGNDLPTPETDAKLAAKAREPHPLSKKG